MTIWIKTNGKEININNTEATIEYAKSLGWKKKPHPKSSPKKKAKK